MTSIMTNTSAMAALQTLRSIGSRLADTQSQVSSGLRVQTASDNAAYWSIATTMRSDNGATSAVQDALGLGAAKVDTAYAGMSAVVDIMSQFKAKLVAAEEDGVDKTKIQSELEQLKQQVQSIAKSASFNGVNYLDTDIADIYDDDLTRSSNTSAFIRDDAGNVRVDTIDLQLSNVALFNSTGGGLLQADARDVGDIGGMRDFRSKAGLSSKSIDYYSNLASNGLATVYNGKEGSGWMLPETNRGDAGFFWLDDFPVGSPLDFNLPGAQIQFDLILDQEASNPDNVSGTKAELYDLPGPYYAGYTKQQITITKADVDAYNPSWGGVISTNEDFADFLNSILEPEGASVNGHWSVNGVHDPKLMSIETLEQHGDGSYVQIANLSSTGVSKGGLREWSDYGERGSGKELSFVPFIVFKDGDNEDGVNVSFTLSVNGSPPTTHSFNRTYINEVLGKDTGKVETAEEWATLLHSMLDPDYGNSLVIEATSSTTVMVKSNPAVDRKWGSGTSIAFSDIHVSIEPLSTMNFLDIDVAKHPEMLDDYIDYINVVTTKITDGTAALGSLKKRLELQTDFTSKLMNSMDSGVGKLVDANMEEESSKLSALQTQQQLALQSLSIANANAENIMQLFR